MTKTFALLASVAALAFTAPAFAADDSAEAKVKVEHDKDGGYTKSSEAEKTDMNGTTTSAESKTKLAVDSDGDTKKTVRTERVTDPKGLFNKQKTVTKDTMKTKGGKTSVEHTKEVNGDTVENTTSGM